MCKLISITSTTLVLLSAIHTDASELPAFEKFGFPISQVQAAVLGPAGVEESSPIPTLTFGGMPASPHQMAVLGIGTRGPAVEATATVEPKAAADLHEITTHESSAQLTSD